MLTCFHHKMTACIFSVDVICENLWQNQISNCDFPKTLWQGMVSTPNKHKNCNILLLPKIQEKYKPSSIFILLGWWLITSCTTYVQHTKEQCFTEGFKPTHQDHTLLYYHPIKLGERQHTLCINSEFGHIFNVGLQPSSSLVNLKVTVLTSSYVHFSNYLHFFLTV